MSLAYAQDYNAVERRLGEAMAAGEITLEQAQVMMDALRKAAGWEGVRKREAMDQRKKEYLAAEEKIRAAVVRPENVARAPKDMSVATVAE